MSNPNLAEAITYINPICYINKAGHITDIPKAGYIPTMKFLSEVLDANENNQIFEIAQKMGMSESDLLKALYKEASEDIIQKCFNKHTGPNATGDQNQSSVRGSFKRQRDWKVGDEFKGTHVSMKIISYDPGLHSITVEATQLSSEKAQTIIYPERNFVPELELRKIDNREDQAKTKEEAAKRSIFEVVGTTKDKSDFKINIMGTEIDHNLMLKIAKKYPDLKVFLIKRVVNIDSLD